LASLPEYRLIGRNYKSHLRTAMLAFSLRTKTDVLRKTAALLHGDLPHSSVQPLGWTDGELFASEAPALLPRWLCDFIGARVYGFFLQTEDGSHFDNRVLAHAPGSSLPQIDYDPQRLVPALAEHQRLRRKLARQLLADGYVPLTKTIPLAGTAHACGTLMAGRDPALSVVDPRGRVHGIENLFVADGSVLPRSSRVNPALTIYAWALRLASLISSDHDAHKHAGTRHQNEIMPPLHSADIS
jgi:choline dehydrogenase-like flavoprotein